MPEPKKYVPGVPAPLPRQEVCQLHFDAQQARLLHGFSEAIAVIGGPRASGARMAASQAATELAVCLSGAQMDLIGRYAAGLLSMLVFKGLNKVTRMGPPATLPPLPALEQRHDILCLASRNQILLKLVDHLPFACDIATGEKLVHIVAHCESGGLGTRPRELGKMGPGFPSNWPSPPHTEAPYECAVHAKTGAAPFPTASILSALWNPSLEATSVIPLPPILDKLGIADRSALGERNIDRLGGDPRIGGACQDEQDERGVSIPEHDTRPGFAVRFDARHFPSEERGSAPVNEALAAFRQGVPVQHILTQESAIIVNTDRALLCDDIVKDNRRLLVRLFGHSSGARPSLISATP